MLMLEAVEKSFTGGRLTRWHLTSRLLENLNLLSSDEAIKDPIGLSPLSPWWRVVCVFGRNIGSHLLINKSVDACFGTDSHVTSLEHVQARLTLSYNRRGNLAIHLISPAGTRSTLLHPRYNHACTGVRLRFRRCSAQPQPCFDLLQTSRLLVRGV